MDISINSRAGTPPLSYCDWLDITFDPESGLWDAVCDFLSCLGATARRVSDHVLEYRLPSATWGNFQLTHSDRGWARLSASGGSCEALRGISAFDEYLHLLGAYPHVVTRLDASLDVRVPAPPVIQSLVSRYPPDSSVYLTRKGVPPDYNLQPCVSGGLTGTFYAGRLDRCRSKVSARVYDKQWERLNRAGEVTGPWLRYEVTVRKGMGVTLRDASDPTLLFWHFAAPALLDAPPGLLPWVPFDGDHWAPGARPSLTAFERLKRRVDASVDLGQLIALARDLPGGGGPTLLLRLIQVQLGLYAKDIADF